MSQQIDGLLAVNKPAGMVSKDVSRWLTRRIGKVKLGHVGTLDPAAAGVLPILLGRATRLQDFLLEMPKSYEFDVAFGIETDTLDQDGQVVSEREWDHISAPSLELAIKSFIGEIEQVPPIYSAVKYQGKPLYDYARGRGGGEASAVPLEGLKRRVNVSSFEMLRFKPGSGTFRITCSKGTYVRSLVRDLAYAVDSCATLTRLVRTQAAGILIENSLSPESIDADLARFPDLVVPISKIKMNLSAWRCPTVKVEGKLRNGQRVILDRDQFEMSLDANEDGARDTVLLMDDSGVAFGVGSIRCHESGSVELVMKRGL